MSTAAITFWGWSDLLNRVRHPITIEGQVSTTEDRDAESRHPEVALAAVSGWAVLGWALLVSLANVAAGDEPKSEVDSRARSYELDGWERYPGPTLSQWLVLGSWSLEPGSKGLDSQPVDAGQVAWERWAAAARPKPGKDLQPAAGADSQPAAGGANQPPPKAQPPKTQPPKTQRIEPLPGRSEPALGRSWSVLSSGPARPLDLAPVFGETGEESSSERRAILVTYINQRSTPDGGRPTRLNLSATGVSGDVWLHGAPVGEFSPGGSRLEQVALPLVEGWNRLVVRLQRGASAKESPRLITQLIGPDGDPTPWWYRASHLPAHQLEYWDHGYQAAGRLWQRAERERLEALSGRLSAFGRDLAWIRVQAKRAGASESAIRKVGLMAQLSRLLVMGGEPAVVMDRFGQISSEFKTLPGGGADKGMRWKRVAASLEEIRPWLVRELDGARAWHCYVTVKHGDHAELWRRYEKIQRLLLDLGSEARHVLREVSKR